MPRLNIYLPNDVAALTEKWRDRINLSEVCARAIREEIATVEDHRAVKNLLSTSRKDSELERALSKHFGLAQAITVDAGTGDDVIRDELGAAAAKFLDANISDGDTVHISGGRQMWCMVRSLSPRRVRATVNALGFGQADPHLLHVHANTLVSLAWLLYAPRSSANLIGSNALRADDMADQAQRFVFASCADFDGASPFVRLLPPEMLASLKAKHCASEFAYVFLDSKGRPIEVPSSPASSSVFSPGDLQRLAARSDAKVVMVAGGDNKLKAMARALSAGLVNVLITDTATGESLLTQSRTGVSHVHKESRKKSV